MPTPQSHASARHICAYETHDVRAGINGLLCHMYIDSEVQMQPHLTPPHDRRCPPCGSVRTLQSASAAVEAAHTYVLLLLQSCLLAELWAYLAAESRPRIPLVCMSSKSRQLLKS